MKGEVVWFYAFDVANEIRTSRVVEVLAEKPAPFTVRRDHTTPRDVPFHQPLSVEPAVDLMVAGLPTRVQVRLYEVGVVSIAIRVCFDQKSLSELSTFHRPALPDGGSLDDFAKSLCARVSEQIAQAMRQRSPAHEPEAYTVFCINDLGTDTTTRDWMTQESANIAGLLSDISPERLSQEQISEAFRHQRSYESSDLVVIDWDAALVVDRTGYVEDVLYVLELANLQLEEFHALDRMLDRYLNRAYEHLEKRPRWFFDRSQAVLGKLRWFRIDLARLTDEVTNITKFIGDWYLARVYLSARARFHLDEWKASVESRLGQLDQIFSVVQSDISERRMLWLEIVIVVFIAIEIVLSIWFKH